MPRKIKKSLPEYKIKITPTDIERARSQIGNSLDQKANNYAFALVKYFKHTYRDEHDPRMYDDFKKFKEHYLTNQIVDKAAENIKNTLSAKTSNTHKRKRSSSTSSSPGNSSTSSSPGKESQRKSKKMKVT